MAVPGDIPVSIPPVTVTTEASSEIHSGRWTRSEDTAGISLSAQAKDTDSGAVSTQRAGLVKIDTSAPRIEGGGALGYTLTDVPADAWYARAVETLASLGMVEGVGGGKFAPERTITRAEFTVMAMRFARLPEGGENPFSDVTSSDWFYDQVVGAV